MAALDALGTKYVVTPGLVRGLDYYTRTVFEFVSDELDAAQSTVCAGGRYDYLIEEIGGDPAPGIGWAAGVERLSMSLAASPDREPIDVFFVCGEGADRPRVLAQMAELRRAGIACDADYAGRSVKGQLTQAGRLKARRVVRVEDDSATIDDETVPVDRIAEAVLR